MCRSYWDLPALQKEYRYDFSYPKARGHHDPAVGELKVRTLSRYLEVAGLRPTGQSVCEVGFGGGHTLAFLAGSARHATGIESVPANIDHAVRLGLRRDRLLLADSLPQFLPVAINLWVFLDSFEHLEDPSRFLDWVAANSGSPAHALVVAPDGGSLSARFMGRLWPHRLPDHPFHWTRKGLVDLFDRHGYRLAHSFYPWKYVSLAMILSHLQLMLSGVRGQVPGKSTILGRAAFRLNVGEMGLVFQKRCP